MAIALNRLDLLTLLALTRLGDDGYGVTVREDITAVTGREASMAAVYVALERLEGLGLVRSWQSDSRPERGGRSRRHFRLTATGRAALLDERLLRARMWRGASRALKASGR
jgi:DNA-binding PadR family transcriptional regulator